MKAAGHALIGIASLALLAPAFGADAPGFNELDRDNDGQVTKAEAARNPALAKRFAEADGDKDGKVSRAEYLKEMAAKDLTSARESVANAIDPDVKDKRPPGFNELDGNDDGKVSRAEAARSPELAKRFGEADGDRDGYVTRAEYLKAMAAVDWRNARDNMADFIRPDDKASGGSSGGAR